MEVHSKREVDFLCLFLSILGSEKLMVDNYVLEKGWPK